MRGAEESVKVSRGPRRAAVARKRGVGLAAVVGMLACIAVFAAAAAGQGGPGPTAAKSDALAATGTSAAAGSAARDITFIDEDVQQGEAAPRNPFAGQGGAGGAAGRKDAVAGCVELSSGEKLPGRIYTTRAHRLRIFNLKREIYEDVPVAAVQAIETIVEWERVDKEWRFKEAGNPEKIFTGRSYPVRQLAWRLTLRGGHEIVGHILGQPLYVEDGGRERQLILHMRDKGPMGAELKDLVYIRRVDFGPEAYERGVAEVRAKS